MRDTAGLVAMYGALTAIITGVSGGGTIAMLVAATAGVLLGWMITYVLRRVTMMSW